MVWWVGDPKDELVLTHLKLENTMRKHTQPIPPNKFNAPRAKILGRFEQLLLHQKDSQSEIVFAMANSGMGNYVFPKAKA